MQYYVKRVGQALFTLYAVATISFVLIRYMPGGPVDYLRAQLLQQYGSSQNTEQRVQELIAVYTNIQTDKPIWEQYINYMGSLLVGDMGQSVWFDRAVSAILAEALPWTVFVAGTALIITFTSGILLGAFMAYVEGSKFDFSLTTGLLASHAVPYYVAALLLLFIFGYTLEWFPTGGRFAPNVEPELTLAFFSSALYHAILPILSLVLTGFGTGAFGMRGNSIQVLGSDYVRVGRLRGLSEYRMITRYVARNAFLPMYTFLLIRIGAVFGGSVILETIFQYRGMGFYIFRAFEARDYPLMMGGFIVTAATVIFALVLADFTYGWLDPRISQGGEHESF